MEVEAGPLRMEMVAVFTVLFEEIREAGWKTFVQRIDSGIRTTRVQIPFKELARPPASLAYSR